MESYRRKAVARDRPVVAGCRSLRPPRVNARIVALAMRRSAIEGSGHWLVRGANSLQYVLDASASCSIVNDSPESRVISMSS